MKNRPLKNRKTLSFIWLLFLIGLSLRIYGAWVFQYNPHPDPGIVRLMAKHIAERRDFPIFFYGQPYMGSIEAIISAIICMVSGCSEFAVSLGTALIGFLLLPVAYIWTYYAGGRWAGITALIFLLIGPEIYFYFLGNPRGGYAITLLLAPLLILLACQIITERLRGKKWLIIFGFLAGLGWWSNQLIIGALITSGILLLIFWKRHILKYIPILLVSFMLGSLPFWIWNYYHNWQTFQFRNSLGKTPFWTGIKLFYIDRLPVLLGLSNIGISLLIPTATIYLLLLSTGIYILFKKIYTEKSVYSSIYLFSSFLFIIISSLIFSTSHFAQLTAPHYLLPILPALALILGIGANTLTNKNKKYLLIAIIFSIIPHISFIIKTPSLYKNMKATYNKAYTLEKFMDDKGIEAIYTYYSNHWLNFALREKKVFSQLIKERYQPYLKKAESSIKIGILDNYGDITHFLIGTRGRFLHEKIENFDIYYNLSPPTKLMYVIKPNLWRVIRDSCGHNLKSILSDQNIATFWESSRKRDWIEISLKYPVKLSGLRLLSSYAYGYPQMLSIVGKNTSEERWQQLTPRLPVTFYYWSGPRPYYGWTGLKPFFGGGYYRMEVYFTPRWVSKLRIYFYKKDNPIWQFQISEINLFECIHGKTAPYKTYIKELFNLLKKRNINRLYCDQWVLKCSNRISGNIPKIHLINTRKYETFKKKEDSYFIHPNPIRFTPYTALLVNKKDQSLTTTALLKEHISMRKTEIGPWVLFDFGKEKWNEKYGIVPLNLYWVGYGCIRGNGVFSYLSSKEKVGTVIEVPFWYKDSLLEAYYKRTSYLYGYLNNLNENLPRLSDKYSPIMNINIGDITLREYKLLRELKIEYIILNTYIRWPKMSINNIDPQLTLKKFRSSPFLKEIVSDKGVYLFKVKQIFQDKNSTTYKTTYPVNLLKHAIGKVIFDKSIKERLLYASSQKNDGPGFLTYGPYEFYPSGTYTVEFWLKAKITSQKKHIASIEVFSPYPIKSKKLARLDIYKKDFSDTSEFKPFILKFKLKRPHILEFRTYFSGNADLWLKKIIISSR